jgi:hypothetical protein
LFLAQFTLSAAAIGNRAGEPHAADTAAGPLAAIMIPGYSAFAHPSIPFSLLTLVLILSSLLGPGVRRDCAGLN